MRAGSGPLRRDKPPRDRPLRDRVNVSVVVPAFDEEDNIAPLTARIEKILGNSSYEILFVDDGSRDRTLEEIKACRKKNQRVHFISLARNFGHQNALKAGLDHARGKCAVTLDADLQHPPELIPGMIEKWREGYDVVFTVRDECRGTRFGKRITSRLFYRLINLISDVHIREGTADFRLLDRCVIDILRKMEEAPFYRGIVPWTGFRQTGIHYTPVQRHSGASKYSPGRMIRFAVSGLVSFSIMPLRIATVLGFLMAISGFIIGLKAIFEYLFTRSTVPGWASTIVSVVFVGGVQLIILGIIGEYLGRLYIESKRRRRDRAPGRRR